MIKSLQGKYHELRTEYPKFIYSGYNISETDEALCLDYHFVIPDLAEFKPHWEIKKSNECAIDLNDTRLNELTFSLGMVELVSYWKATCSQKVQIACGNLSQEQSEWWRKLYKKGLGEFFYTNGIEADDDFMNIICREHIEQHNHSHNHNAYTENLPSYEKTLIPVGGGKDSAVTIELLKNHTDRFCYIINPRKATLDTVATASIPADRIIIAKRTIDKNIIDLNKRGFLNGHTPFSAVVAFSSVIAAYIHKIGLVALSNESTASEPTVLDSDVNHQYSKSLEFETDFIEFEAKYISSGVKYFSFLRPLTEIGIAKIFSQLDSYHSIFRSCNVGSKNDIWCADCPKCLFVYIILSPFLPSLEMEKIFGRNMLDEIELTADFEKLAGLQPEKPFECVGSRDEVNAALQELVRIYGREQKPLPKLLEAYSKFDALEKQDIAEMCSSFDENNHVPKQFVQLIKAKVN